MTVSISPAHRGQLHKSLGVPGDKKIGIGALMAKGVKSAESKPKGWKH